MLGLIVTIWLSNQYIQLLYEIDPQFFNKLQDLFYIGLKN